MYLFGGPLVGGRASQSQGANLQITCHASSTPIRPTINSLAAIKPKLKYVSKADVDFLVEEISGNAYLQHGVALKSGDTVVDCGANIGIFGMQAASAVGHQGRVIAAEPLPPTFQALQQNIQIHETWCNANLQTCAHIEDLRCGIGDGSTRTADFTLYPRAAGWGTLTRLENDEAVLQDMHIFLENAVKSSSILLSPPLRLLGQILMSVSPEVFKAVAALAVRYMLADKQRFTCDILTVSEIITSLSLKQIDLLKIDCERAEVGVLRGILPQHWGMVRQVAAEVHEENLEQFGAILKEAGFQKVVIEQTNDLIGSSIYMVYCCR